MCLAGSTRRNLHNGVNRLNSSRLDMGHVKSIQGFVENGFQ